ncbi:MAG: AbrB/MazE/SpoVT family DNA-binding domain-containing protein [Chloroflexota bacterium]
MATLVGAKGQVVTDQPIRERLGVSPGMLAVQTVDDNTVVIRFLPAEHNESLAGSLRPHVKRWPSSEQERQQ